MLTIIDGVGGATWEAPWASGDSLRSDPRLADANMPPEVTFEQCALAATGILYKRSGRRFRLHSVLVRPNESGSDCGCAYGVAELELPGPVVPETIVVTIDGVALASTNYRLWSGNLLVRTDGLTWPTCSHLSTFGGLDWSIAFTYGQGPDMDGVLACRELAIHVALSLCGKVSKIPARATSVSRQGVSINLARGKRFGITLVDDWLDAVNPHGLMGRPSVMSPDTIRLSRQPVTGETIYDGGAGGIIYDGGGA